MKTRCLLGFALAWCSLAACAQQAPSPADAGQPGSPARKGLVRRTPESAESARKQEHHIRLDVVVTDVYGKRVAGLSEHDFSVWDDGKMQAITSFQAVTAPAASSPVEVILLLDTRNNSFQNVAFERQGMEKFLSRDGGHLGVPVSVAVLSDSGTQINLPSSDGKALAADLRKVATPVHMIGAAEGFNGAIRRFQSSIRTLDQLAAYESTKPGRKLLIWIGPGWPMLSASSFHMSPANQRAFFNTIVRVSSELRNARITLYSISPPDLTRGTDIYRFYYKSFVKGVKAVQRADSGNLAQQVLAYQSGGLVVDSSEDLDRQIAACVADASTYYAISFDAAPAAKADEYHSLEIRLDRPGLTARTNTAYYAQP